jgi:hypothetical protein
VSTPQPPSAHGKPEPSSQPDEAWSQPPDISLPAPTPDVLASPEPSVQDGRRRRTPLVFVAAAAVVALVLGGAAYAGSRLWYGSGAQPEQAAPSTVLAFARLDLSPGYGQRLKINDLLEKFPGASGEDTAEELTEGIFDMLDIDEASYRGHVEPWFGQRIGVALWLDDAQRPYGLIVLAVDDEAAARTGLAELQREDGADKVGFALRDGWALVANGDEGAQEAAEAAAGDADRESLADSAQFRDDADWLPARQTALAWVDLAGVGAVFTEQTGASPARMQGSTFFGMDGMAGLAPGLVGFGLDELDGRLVVGAQATGDGVEIRFRGFGMDAPAQPPTTDARSTVDGLPANSAVAVATRAGSSGGSVADRIPGFDQALSEDLRGELPPGLAEAARARILASRKQFEALDKAFSAVAGAQVSLAMTEVNDDLPALAVTAVATTPANAEALADAARLIGDAVTVTTSGTKVELTTKGYAAEGGTLGDQALYRQALDGAPENATAVGYVDMQRLLADMDLSEKDRRHLEPVKAIGAATGTEDGDVVALLRVVIK